MILSIIMAVSFYVLVVLAVGYVMNAEQIKTSMLSATGLVTADAMGVAFNNANMAKSPDNWWSLRYCYQLEFVPDWREQSFVFYVCFLYASQEICCTT